MVFGLMRYGTLHIAAEMPDYPLRYTKKQVTVHFPAATAEQKEALGYVEPSDPDFKADCTDAVLSADLQTFMAGKAEAEALTNDIMNAGEWTHVLEVKDGEDLVATATFDLRWDVHAKADVQEDIDA